MDTPDFLLQKLTELNSGVSAVLLEDFARAMPLKKFRKGETIAPAGKVASEVFFVEKGCVRMLYYLESKEVTASFFFEGGFTGPCISMMFKTINQQVFEAFEDCHIRTLNFDTYMSLLRQQPCFYQLRSTIAESIMADQELIIRFFLSFTPMERYQYLIKNQPQLFMRVPQHHIASMIGITPVSLSRIRKRIAC
ncbi:Crp/Fnr family transcriptional regulator [Cesiribacter sp. SM1]|uniref:Crp/Fnr family transcriptional regulator n=1 Tax=Cesiribacter sp. SM1 TaxID=2861196 RepID=UPI001CD289A5|nr:Crp/Fnr family transcriptional regulator [Cesiribacter sp. SM1]